MPDRLARVPMVYGTCRFESALMSNRWRLLKGKEVLAELQRVPSRHISILTLPGQPPIELAPHGWGTVVARQGGRELGRVVRQTWWGRRWALSGPGFACELTSDPVPRRWSLRFGAEPVARLSGGLFSYNRLKVNTHVAVPIASLALAWHVLARPWEAAAAPGALVPARDSYRVVGAGG